MQFSPIAHKPNAVRQDQPKRETIEGSTAEKETEVELGKERNRGGNEEQDARN
jgi:hypothetical protein